MKKMKRKPIIIKLNEWDDYYKNENVVYHKHNFADYSGSPITCARCGKPSYIGDTTTPFVEKVEVNSYIRGSVKYLISILKGVKIPMEYDFFTDTKETKE